MDRTYSSLLLSGDGDDRTAAIEHLIEDLRKYASGSNERLHETANHREKHALVIFVDRSDDEQLKTGSRITKTLTV